MQDPTGENWWVTVLDHAIGYYPPTVFDTRFPQAVYVEMGGRVLDTRPGGNHTTTPMGNGIPSCAGSRFAATIMDYHAVNYNGGARQQQGQPGRHHHAQLHGRLWGSRGDLLRPSRVASPPSTGSSSMHLFSFCI